MNKIDVDKYLVNEFCNEKEVEHIYTSAKTGEGLEDIFYKVAKKIAHKVSSGQTPLKNKKTLKIENRNSDESKSNSRCC